MSCFRSFRNRRTAQFGGNDTSQNSIKTQDLLKAMDEESKVSHKLKDSQEEDKEVIPNLHYNAEKAGMASIDKETIQKKIIEASKGSSYYKKKQERTEKAKAKAKEWMKEIRKLKSNRSYWSKVTKQLNNKASDMRSKRDLSRTWIHVDMDMFYAAVAIHDNPSLKDIPIAVGGMQMISTANYVARKYGVRSAMPGFIGKKLCPELKFVDHQHERYKEISEIFRKVLSQYDPNYESMGLDECNLDVTDYLIKNGINDDQGREKLAQEIRDNVNKATELTCSAGVGANKMLAKICSDMNKPNGHYILPHDPQKIEELMANIEIRKIPGIGPVSQTELNELGIEKGKDFLDKAPELYCIFEEKTVYRYMRDALGISRNVHEDVDPNYHQKSISISRTFRTIKEKAQFIKWIDTVAGILHQNIKEKELMGRTITLEVKDQHYNLKSKGRTLRGSIDKKEDIIKEACELLNEIWPCEPARLIGISLSNLIKKSEYTPDKSIGKYFSKPKNTQEYHDEMNRRFLMKTSSFDASKPKTRVPKEKTNSSKTARKPVKKINSIMNYKATKSENKDSGRKDPPLVPQIISHIQEDHDSKSEKKSDKAKPKASMKKRRGRPKKSESKETKKGNNKSILSFFTKK
ncbi:unnamed protein product [Moneuplotes crassus]|uniref:DNA polymerase kappa n=1 Tax=Euplotes crassus TaxID=5936 RepID=A0AAD1U0E0_EUPCR|nr:unnamed protein product [Moneuplotes crassus]